MLEVLGVSARLGVTSFGGPVAHLGYFREEYVGRRRWVDERGYADLVALCQLLPGPNFASLAVALGCRLRGWAGGAWALLAIVAPGAGILLILAVLYTPARGAVHDAATAGLAAVATLALGVPWVPPVALVLAGGVAGWLLGL